MDRRPLFKRTLFWLALGVIAFGSFPLVKYNLERQFKKSEPYYLSPLAKSRTALYLRSDSFGKGFFAASRNGGRRHKGLDLLSSVGDPVVAAKSGRVTFSGEDKGYGYLIEISHPDGLLTRYAHLSALHVTGGEWVGAGQIVGLSGRSGNADDRRIRAHLHFEIRHIDGAVNPTHGLLDPSIQILQG